MQKRHPMRSSAIKCILIYLSTVVIHSPEARVSNCWRRAHYYNQQITEQKIFTTIINTDSFTSLCFFSVKTRRDTKHKLFEWSTNSNALLNNNKGALITKAGCGSLFFFFRQMISVQDAATNWPVYSTLHTDTATAFDGGSSRRTQAAAAPGGSSSSGFVCLSSSCSTLYTALGASSSIESRWSTD